MWSVHSIGGESSEWRQNTDGRTLFGRFNHFSLESVDAVLLLHSIGNASVCANRCRHFYGKCEDLNTS